MLSSRAKVKIWMEFGTIICLNKNHLHVTCIMCTIIMHLYKYTLALDEFQTKIEMKMEMTQVLQVDKRQCSFFVIMMMSFTFLIGFKKC